MNTLQKILDTPSASGRTNEMQKLLKDELCDICDNVATDVLGSISFTKKLCGGKKLLICTGFDAPSVVATFIDKSQINISPVGAYNPASMAFSCIKFENVQGVLVPSSNYDPSSSATDYVVQTQSEDEAKKVVLGDIGIFDEKYQILSDGTLFGFSSSTKMCIYSLLSVAKKLLSPSCTFLEENGIGKICFSFISQQSLGNRGASCVSRAFNPDFVISIAPFDMTEKNVGSFDFEDGLAVKMLDRGFVADEKTALLAEKILDFVGAKHKRRVSNASHSAIDKLCLCESGALCAEIGVPFKFGTTRGECTKKVF